MRKKLLLITILVLLVGTLLTLSSCEKEKEVSSPHGEIYTLQKAYEEGFLTREDLKNISYYSNVWVHTCEETLGNNLRELSEENTEKMKRLYASLLRSEYGIENAEASGITIKKCYGTYHEEYIAVMFSGYLESNREDRTEEDSEGNRIRYNYSDEKIYFWIPSLDNDGKLYALRQAQEKKIYQYVNLDILDIARLQNSSAQMVDFTPRTLEPKTLPTETVKEIQETMAYQNGVDASEVSVTGYYGTYTGNVACTTFVKSFIYTTEVPEYTIDGIYFYRNRIDVWVEKE